MTPTLYVVGAAVAIGAVPVMLAGEELADRGAGLLAIAIAAYLIFEVVSQWAVAVVSASGLSFLLFGPVAVLAVPVVAILISTLAGMGVARAI